MPKIFIKFIAYEPEIDRIGWKFDQIEMDRPPNVQISNINFAFFARFFEKPTKPSETMKKRIF